MDDVESHSDLNNLSSKLKYSLMENDGLIKNIQDEILDLQNEFQQLKKVGDDDIEHSE